MYLGFDIGGSSIKAVLVADKKIIKSKIEVLPDNLLALLAKIESMAQEISGLEKIEAAGFGIAGTWTKKRETILRSCNIPFLDNQPIKRILQEKFGAVPVFINQDAYCFLLAEKTVGQAQALQSAVLLTIGSGIGCAWMVGGEILVGANGGASEGGHMIIDIVNELDLEAVASNKLFKKMLRVESIEVERRWREGDQAATKAFKTLGRNLGMGIANILNFFDPEAVIINGGIAAAKEIMVGEIQASIEKFVISPLVKKTPILFSELGRLGGALGAALLAESSLGVKE